jgi:hypothetical protein
VPWIAQKPTRFGQIRSRKDENTRGRWLGPPRELAWNEIARAALPINTNYLLQGASGKPTFLIDASRSHVERLLKFVEPHPFWTDRMSPARMARQAVIS